MGNDLSREEITELTSILVNKIWERRNGIRKTGNRFTKQLLTLVANKLERGERDTRKVPVVAAVATENGGNEAKKEEEGGHNNNNAAALVSPPTPARTSSSRTFSQPTSSRRVKNGGSNTRSSSERLLSARSLLNELTTVVDEK